MKQRIESVFWKTIEKNHPGRGEKSNKKNEESLRNILDDKKHNNIYIMGVPEGGEREQEIKNLFKEIMT